MKKHKQNPNQTRELLEYKLHCHIKGQINRQTWESVDDGLWCFLWTPLRGVLQDNIYDYNK